MTAALQTIRLGGDLGRKFGRRHQLAVGTAAEAVHALCQLMKGFEAYLTEAKDRGVTFAVFVGGRNIPKDELTHPADGEIRFLPVLIGAKNGGPLLTIVGAILVVVGYLFIWTPFGAPLIYAGVALMAAGIAIMLTPTPKDPQSEDEPEKQASYAFNGPTNTQAQGNPVPILYGGPMYIGSAVISASIDAKEQAYIPRTTGGSSGGGSTASHVEAVTHYLA